MSIVRQLVTAASKEVLIDFVNLYVEHASTMSEDQQTDIIQSIEEYVFILSLCMY